jgi:hypothetical protein
MVSYPEKLFDGKRYYLFRSYSPTSAGRQQAKRVATMVRKLPGEHVKARFIVVNGLPMVYTMPQLLIK